MRESFLGISVYNIHTCVYINAYKGVGLYSIYYVYMHVFYILYTHAYICVYINISVYTSFPLHTRVGSRQSDNSFFLVEGCGEKQDKVHVIYLEIKNCNIDKKMKTLVGLWP